MHTCMNHFGVLNQFRCLLLHVWASDHSYLSLPKWDRSADFFGSFSALPSLQYQTSIWVQNRYFLIPLKMEVTFQPLAIMKQCEGDTTWVVTTPYKVLFFTVLACSSGRNCIVPMQLVKADDRAEVPTLIHHSKRCKMKNAKLKT